jgi:hypothetical protein
MPIHNAGHPGSLPVIRFPIRRNPGRVFAWLADMGPC